MARSPRPATNLFRDFTAAFECRQAKELDCDRCEPTPKPGSCTSNICVQREALRVEAQLTVFRATLAATTQMGQAKWKEECGHV
jgi:hypothetical protein